MSEEDKKYDDDEIEEISEAFANAKDKIPKKAIRIGRTLVKDPHPLNIPMGCKKFDLTGKMIDRTELSINGEEGLDLLNEIRFLKGLIDGVDTYSRTYSKEQRKFVSSKITNGQSIIPFENTKLFRDIKYEKLKFMDPSKITGIEGYLDVDKIFPVITKGRPIDYDKFSEKLNDETPSMQVDENRCYVIFEKFLDNDKKIKVKAFFNPLCNQIGFFMFIGEPNPDKTSADKYLFEKICFRSFYKVINNKIVFRPYSHLKPPLPASRPRNVKKDMKNIIVDINTILGNENFKITTTYEELMDILYAQTEDLKDKLFNVLLPLNNEINKALFETACGRIKNRYNEFQITDRTNYYNTLLFLKDKKLNKKSVKEIFGFFINKDMFVKKIETLKKKFLYYMEHYDEKKLTIDKFETQVIPVQMGTPNLAMEDAITIKRFLKLDPIFELYKTKEVQFRKIDRDDVVNQEDIVFSKESYMKERERLFDEKASKLRIEQEPRNFGQYDAKISREKVRFLREEESKFDKKYGEGNRKVYVKFEQELYETVSYAYFRPFTLSDIILTRYRKVSLFDHFGFSKEPSELLQSLNTLFLNIEELRSFVFTFVSLYYQLKTDISSKKARVDVAGRFVNSAGTLLQNPEFVETGPSVKLNIYKIYPNQLYSKEDHHIKTAKKTFKYYSTYQKAVRTRDSQIIFDYNYFLLKKEDSDDANPLRFLQLEEGIVGEAYRPKYIKPEELFVPELEIGLVEKNVDMINKAFTKLTTIEPRIKEWVGPSEDDIAAMVEIKVSPDGSLAAKLRSIKDIPQPVKTHIANIVKIKAKAERKKKEDEDEDDDDDDDDDDNIEGPQSFQREEEVQNSENEGEIGEDADAPTGLIGFRKNVKDRRDKRPDQTKKEIFRIFTEHLEWLIKQSSGARGVTALKEAYKHTDKKVTMDFIKKQPDGFNKKLAYEIEEHKERFRESIYQWKMADRNELHLDGDKKSILTFYFQSGANVTKAVVTAFILYLHQLGGKLDKDLLVEKIPDDIRAPVNNEQKSVLRLVGDDFRVATNIIQTIFLKLEEFKDDPSHTKEFKFLPEYLEKADLYWTLRNKANQLIFRDKIQGYVYIFKRPETHAFEFPAESAIFESLYNADVEKNISGLKSLIEFLNSNKLIKPIIQIKKHYPRKLRDEAEDKAARDEIIRENEALVVEIIALRELKGLTKEQFGEIERKMLQLTEDARRINQNIEADLIRINASGKAKFKILQKTAEQESRAAANRGEVSNVASKLAALSKPVVMPVAFDDTPAGRDKKKLADKEMKKIRRLEEKVLILRRQVGVDDPSLIIAENTYKEAVKYGNETFGLGIVELEDAKQETKIELEQRAVITAQSMIDKLKELDSTRKRFYKEMKALSKPERPSKEATGAVQMEFNRLNSAYGRELKQATLRYEQANELYKENINKAAKYGVAVVYVDPEIEESSALQKESVSEIVSTSEVPQVLSSEHSSELPSVLSTEPASELGVPKGKTYLGKKVLTRIFKSDFGNLVSLLKQLEIDPTNSAIKSRVKTAYEKYLATKIQFIEVSRSDVEAEIKKFRTEKKEEMDLVDAYEAKHGGNSEANKQKYMKYKLKYMKLKELLDL